jgi:putative restriction endonuclease
VTRDQLTNDFAVGGTRFPLVDAGRGIRRPRGWSAALSILTAVPKGSRGPVYDDAEGPDGYHRYKLRRDARGAAENDGLRTAMSRQTPLIWFSAAHPACTRPSSPCT